MNDLPFDHNLRFNVSRSNHGMTVEVYASRRERDDGGNGAIWVVLPAKLELKKLNEWTRTEELPGPMLTLSPEDAQRLADALYNANFRPTGEAKAAGEVGAIKSHLADMRRLVAKFTGVEL